MKHGRWKGLAKFDGWRALQRMPRLARKRPPSAPPGQASLPVGNEPKPLPLAGGAAAPLD